MSRVLLISGGFDSACAWWALGKPDALYVGGADGPARYANDGEVAALLKMASISPEFKAKLGMMPFDFSPFMREGVWAMPRDMILCQLAWAQGYDEAMIAWVADDGTTESWARKQADNFWHAVGMSGFSVSFPVAHLTKAALLEQALTAGMPLEFAHASHSCVRLSLRHCGQCDNCKQRENALGVLV